MSYEINVSKKRENSKEYSHYFATAPRSLKSKEETKDMLLVFLEKFPEPEYKISVSYNPETGFYYPTPESFLNEK